MDAENDQLDSTGSISSSSSASRRTVLRSGALGMGAGALVGAMGVNLSSTATATAATLPSPPTGTPSRNFFLKLDGIAGDSRDRNHAGEIPLLGIAWGVKNATGPTSGGGGGTGKAVQTEFRFLSATGVASPLLFLAVVNGKRLKSAVFSVVKPSDQRVVEVKITLEDVVLTQYETYPDAVDAHLLDLVSLSYDKITYSYTAQDPKGGVGRTITTSWNFRTNSTT